jgi:hypothetical protein
LDASESRSEICGNDVNVVLEKDGEDEFDCVRNEEVLHTVNKENEKRVHKKEIRLTGFFELFYKTRY